MAVYGGPDIVTDGLVLHLDAGNSKSYSGSGNTWYDLSGVIGNVNVASRNNDWSFVNDPQTGQRCIYNNTDRTSNAGIDIPTNTGFSKLAGTIEIWLKPAGNHLGGHGWFNNSDGSAYTNNNNWFWIGTWDTSNWFYFRVGNASTCCNDTTIGSFRTSQYPLDIWNFWTITWNVSAGTTTIYKNQNLVTQRTNMPTNITNINPTNTGQLFNGHVRGDNQQFKGYCNTYKIYNRALTPQEIQQNYLATKGRFGL